MTHLPDLQLGDRRPIPAVGVVCLRGAEVLLIRRGTPPRLGEWSLPGGRIEWGEPIRTAALRELQEETGVEAELLDLIEVVDGVFTSRQDGTVTRHYVLIDFLARWTGGEPRAGDDAADARFWPIDQIGHLGLWDQTLKVIAAGHSALAARQA